TDSRRSVHASQAPQQRVSSDCGRPPPEREAGEMLHLAAPEPGRSPLLDSSGRGPPAAGGLCSPCRRRSGAICCGYESGSAAPRFKLAAIGTDEPAVSRRAGAVLAWLSDGVPTAVQGISLYHGRVAVRRSAFRGVVTSRAPRAA